MYIQSLIAKGEGQQLDFKYHISNAAKIAKTLVAFANTDGGRLLIGVKDNGNVVGVESEEEVYMIELAAEKYCRPAVEVKLDNHVVDNRTVLEVYVPPSSQKPHYAKEETGKWQVYIRKEDENLLANKVLVEVFKRKKNKTGTVIQYKKPERTLLDYLRQHNQITFPQFCRIAAIPPWIAKRVLVNLVMVGVIKVHITEKENYFILAPSQMIQEQRN